MESKSPELSPSSRMSGFKVPAPRAPGHDGVGVRTPAPAAPLVVGHVSALSDTPAPSRATLASARIEGAPGPVTFAAPPAPAPTEPARPQETASAPAPAPAGEGEEKQLSYTERLERIGMTLDTALAIVDEVATGQGYTESFKVARGIAAVFTTRSTRFNNYLSRTIDLFDPRKVGYMNQIMSEHQLAASLVSYAGQPLPELSDEMPNEAWEASIKARVEFVRQLPGPLFLTLCARLTDFDTKMLVVFSKGYDEHF